MGDTKLAKHIYGLAMEVESGTNTEAGGAGFESQLRREALQVEAEDKTAERMVKFQDPAGNVFMLPYDLVGNRRWVYSPYDRSKAERTEIMNVQLTGKAEELFLSTDKEADTTVTDKEASDKTADKMVQFRDEAGRTFVLPYDNVGYARWAYSPFDRSRAQRTDVINVQLTGKLEEAVL